MKKVTSAVANKILKGLADDKEYLLAMENSSAVYVLADGEKSEPPAYDYRETQDKIDRIDKQMRRIKHAINVFNVSTVLEGIGITIDEALVEMAQLTRKKDKLDVMRKRLPKSRINEMHYRGSGAVEYQYVNYDLDKVSRDYQSVCDRINNLQVALDMANQTMFFEIED